MSNVDQDTIFAGSMSKIRCLPCCCCAARLRAVASSSNRRDDLDMPPSDGANDVCFSCL